MRAIAHKSYMFVFVVTEKACMCHKLHLLYSIKAQLTTHYLFQLDCCIYIVCVRVRVCKAIIHTGSYVS